jgi:hypothetical protein
MGVHMSVMVNIFAQATVPAFRKVFMRSVGVFKEWAVYLTVVEAQSKQFHLRGLDMTDEITQIPMPVRPSSRVDGGGQSLEHGFGESRLGPWDVDRMALC